MGKSNRLSEVKEGTGKGSQNLNLISLGPFSPRKIRSIPKQIQPFSLFNNHVIAIYLTLMKINLDFF